MRPTPQASRRTATVAAIAVVVGATFTASATGAYARPVRAVAVASSDPAAAKAAAERPRVFANGWSFGGPTNVLLDGSNLFVAGQATVTELNTSTGALVRLVPPAWYGFSSPNAMVRHGDELYVLNSDQTEGVTVLNASSGAAMGVLSGGFDFPEALAAYSDELCASPPYGCPNFAVTEVNGNSGAVVRVISGGSFDYPDAMVVDGADSVRRQCCP